jgi:hypothetical protein
LLCVHRRRDRAAGCPGNLNGRGAAAGFEPSCDRITYELVGCGDDGLMTPEQAIGSLHPVPLYIQYQ